MDDALTVLLVDDEPGIREALAAGLADAGMIVVQSSDCPQAQRMIEMVRFDVAVVDYTLPSCTGLDLARELRRNQVQRVPVILISGAWVPDDPAFDFLLFKPITSAQLVAAIHSLLG